ncbi:MAG: O-antigen ligase family protein [Patescibacteria group bacterium]
MKTSLLGNISALLLVLLPFFPRFGLLSGAVTGKFFLVIGLLEITFLVAALRIFKQGSTISAVRRPFLLSLVVVVMVQVAAALFGVFPEYSLLGDSSRVTSVLFFGHLVVWAIILGEFLTTRDWALVRKSLLIGAMGVSVLSIIGLDGLGYTGNVLGYNFSARGVSFGNETFAGIYLILALIIGGVEFLKTKSVFGKWAVGTALVVTTLSPILSNFKALLSPSAFERVLSEPSLLLGSTRASSTVLFASIVFLIGWWLSTHISHQKLRVFTKAAWASASLTACLVGFMLIILPGSLVQREYADETTYSRFLVWQIATEAVHERPVLGWGPENFSRAFEAHIDPALYEVGDATDVLFDRAHNVVLDTLVTSGGLGVLSGIVMLAFYALVIWRARRRGDIGEGECVLWLLLPVAHLVQLSTAFDVVPTYVLLAVVAGHALYLEREQHPRLFVPKKVVRIIAAVGIVLSLASFSYAFLYEMPRQASLVASLSSSREDERAELIEFSTSRLSDFEGLRRTSNLFVGSVYEQILSNVDRDLVERHALKYLEQYLSAHERYLAQQPTHYRAHANYAYLLLVKTHLNGGDGTEKVLRVVEHIEPLSPRNPTNYLLSIMAHAYRGDFVAAYTHLEELRVLIPESVQVHEAAIWLDTQQKLWPVKTIPGAWNL